MGGLLFRTDMSFVFECFVEILFQLLTLVFQQFLLFSLLRRHTQRVFLLNLLGHLILLICDLLR